MSFQQLFLCMYIRRKKAAKMTFVQKTRVYNVDEIDASFLRPFPCAKILQTQTVMLRKTLAYKKAAHKMLMKLSKDSMLPNFFLCKRIIFLLYAINFVFSKQRQFFLFVTNTRA